MYKQKAELDRNIRKLWHAINDLDAPELTASEVIAIVRKSKMIPHEQVTIVNSAPTGDTNWSRNCAKATIAYRFDKSSGRMTIWVY